MNIAVFAHNFPHKKTQDFLWRLITDGFQPQIVLACNSVNLDVGSSNNSSTLRVKPRHTSVVHPQQICRKFGISYYVVEHNSQNCVELLHQHNINLGIISGAYLLKQHTIQAVTKGIINFHPGVIPNIRGLDALEWAVYEGCELGVTSHVIDKRIDAGRILKKVIIPEYQDDSLVDLSLRLYETQLDLIHESIELISNYPIEQFQLIGKGEGKVFTKMPPELKAQLPILLARRLRGFF